MKLITKDIEKKLEQNMKLPEKERKPVMKLFTPDAGATWLISEVNEDTMFGLCDLGLGFPELGYVSLDEIQSVRGKLGLPVERDRGFRPDKTLAEYAQEAQERGRIVT